MKVSEALANFDMEFNFEEGEFVTDVIVIAKTSELNGRSSVYVKTSPDCDVITQLGLLEAGRQITNGEGNWKEAD